MRFLGVILEFENVYRESLENGVRLMLATHRHIPHGKVMIFVFGNMIKLDVQQAFDF